MNDRSRQKLIHNSLKFELKRQANSLTIIIPAFNEGENIEVTLIQLISTLKKLSIPFEIIVIDDGSLDGTGIIAEEYGANLVIRNYVHKGKGNSILSGLVNASGKIIILMDADGSYNPEDIPKLISPILCGDTDLVIGYSYPSKTSLLYRFGRMLLSTVYKILLGLDVVEIFSGFKAIKKDLLITLVENMPSSGFEFDLNLLINANKKGYRITEIPLEMRKRYSSGHSQLKNRLFREGLRKIYQIYLKGLLKS